MLQKKPRTYRAIQLLSEKGQEFRICDSHTVLGLIYQAKGETEKAIYHLKTTLRITSRFGWNGLLSFMAHRSLAELFIKEDKFDDAHAHLEQAKLHTVNSAYHQGQIALMQVTTYYNQYRLEDAMSEVLRALRIFEELGIQNHINDCRDLLEEIKGVTKSCDTSALAASFLERLRILCPLTLSS